VRSELGRQKSQNSTSIGLPRWITLTPRPATFAHGKPEGNSGATIVSTGARKLRAYPIEPTISN
jgi:hypothetical protein